MRGDSPDAVTVMKSRSCRAGSASPSPASLRRSSENETSLRSGSWRSCAATDANCSSSAFVRARSRFALSSASRCRASSRCTARASVTSRIEAETRIPPSVSSGLKLISTGNSQPSLWRA